MKPENVKVDLRISVLKPLQAKWVTSFYDKMQSRQDIVKKAWERAGITEVNMDKSKENFIEDPFL